MRMKTKNPTQQSLLQPMHRSSAALLEKRERASNSVDRPERRYDDDDYDEKKEEESDNENSDNREVDEGPASEGVPSIANRRDSHPEKLAARTLVH